MIARSRGRFPPSGVPSSNPVSYTHLVQVKHIRKPNGAKPGYVIYENQKTVIVTPEEEKIIAMKQNG